MTAPGLLVPGGGTCLVLLLSTLLLLTSSIQGGPELWVLSTADMEPAAGHPASRVARMTPFWRMVGNKPPGAHCRHSLECITKACRAGRCSSPSYVC
ncbi:liver-expressed antimicrobial peptide 2 [Nothoprocta perdicaria]|uniref:liver-expressed antimicrobial peptide 2 n=1 Tax=Nothoprocta perdicaria TaxID=30464 RepID=UPI000E1B9490|nr:liver-expressed antimicrobial peptide 2 [Nothoprocta perdicaria]